MKISILIFSCLLFPFAFANLRIGFYNFSCPTVEAVVNDVVRRHFSRDKSISAGLLRMHFHDCFVRGCDASLLIDPTNNRTSEKLAIPNQTIRGYDIIDEAKNNLEQICPSTVSCADILTLATRDAVAFAGGPTYIIPTGRRDGLVSNPSEVNLPGPQLSVSQSLPFFTTKGLTLNDMVTLLGAHTIGFTHCSFFLNRIRRSDPSMDPTLRVVLARFCESSTNPTAFLDQGTPFLFDNQFYNQILHKRGVLNIDQQLALDPSTKDLVLSFATNRINFQRRFAKAMIKLGSVGVLVGNQGEIRKNCRAFNFPL